MASIFSKIIDREIPADIIYEDEYFCAFLDVFPVAEGHTLLVPKKEVDYIYDLDDDLLVKMQLLSKRLAIALRGAIDCKRIATAVIGLEVPHAHLHLVPIHTMSDMDFGKEKKLADKEQQKIIAQRIIAHI